jgi:hypothetical protein
MLAAWAFKGAPITARRVGLNGHEPHACLTNLATRTRYRAQNWSVSPHVCPQTDFEFKYLWLRLSCKKDAKRRIERPDGTGCLTGTENNLRRCLKNKGDNLWAEAYFSGY